jgi:hypothetical protein
MKPVNWTAFRAPAPIEECFFYHIQKLPGMEIEVGKNWDLRPGINDYFGGVDFKDKTVIELGPASGFVTFEMEKRGAQVSCIELDENGIWDRVPMCQYDRDWHLAQVRDRKVNQQKIINGFWTAHKLHRSKARVLYCHIYDLPSEIGNYDICMLGTVLLHLRDPFLALQNILAVTKEKVIITDMMPDPVLSSFKNKIRHILGRISSDKANSPYVQFLPNFKTREHPLAWWLLSPEAIVRMAGILGFERSTITYHQQKHHDNSVKMFTVVCERTQPMGIYSGLEGF